MIKVIIDDDAVKALRFTRKREKQGETRFYYIHTTTHAVVISRQHDINDLAGQTVEALAGNDKLRPGKSKLTITGVTEKGEDTITLSKWLETTK